MRTAFIVGLLMFALVAAPVLAGENEVKSMVKNLKPVYAKGLQPPSPSVKVLRIKGLAAAKAVSKQLVEQVEAPAENVVRPPDSVRPHVDMQINFDFNQASIRSDQLGKLKDLGEALTSKDLAKNKFSINGHTDTVGESEYNQKLSLRRAAAISVWLIENFGAQSGKETPLTEDRLEVRGFGKSCPKDQPGRDNFKSEVNRRVEIETLSGSAN